MFKSVNAIKDNLKGKPVLVSQDDNQLIITNKTTNHGVFELKLKLFNNGTTVNIKPNEYASLQQLPVEQTRTISLFKLTHKIFRINACQGKPVILISNTENKVKITNTINNTEYETDIVNGDVVLSETDYKAIRNPKVVDETGNPLPLREVIKRNNPNFGTKRVKKVVETSRFITVESLKHKIDRINEINETSHLIMHRQRKGFLKITNALVEPVDIFRMPVIKVDDVDGVEIPLENFKKIRNPQHYDADGNPITLAQYLKSKPKKERVKKERVKKEKVVKEKPVKVEKPVEYKTISVPDDLLVETTPSKLRIRIDRINKIEKTEIIVFEFDKVKQLITLTNTVNNTRYSLRVVNKVVVITKLDLDAIKLPVKRDANGKRIKLTDRN
jgi:hypothetical protein